MAAKRVYLDQWVWIRLSQAAHGLSEGAPYVDALHAVERASASGTFEFPLSSIHYFETHKQRDPVRRQRLAVVMALMSRMETIAHPGPILTMEVDHAVEDVFGLRVDPRDTAVFGFGFCHAFDLDPGFAIPEALPAEARMQIRRQVELAILIAVPAMEPLWDLVRSLASIGPAFADDESRIADQLASGGLHRGGKLRRSMAFVTLRETIDPIIDSLRRGGASDEAILDLVEQGAPSLLERVPSRHVIAELRHVKHQNRQQRWEANDMTDLIALSTAIPYCDVVVTERTWADAAARARLGERYGTTILGDPRRLPELLAA